MTDRINAERLSIRLTDQHGKFVFHEQNRVLRDPASGATKIRKDLIESMKAEGYRLEEPITAYANEDGTYTIIDGHNRLIAAQSLGIPVAYIAYRRNGQAEWTPVRHSNGGRMWSVREIATAYAQNGNEHYAELLEYCDRTGIGIMEASSMLYGHAANTTGAIKVVKAGTFVVRDRIHADIVAGMVATCAQFVHWANDSRLVAALSACLFVDGFSPVQMRDKIAKYPEFLEKQKSRDDFIELLDKIYNRSAKTRLELVFGVRNAMRERNIIAKRTAACAGKAA